MRRFESVRGDIYVGYVIAELPGQVVMNNYSVWCEDTEDLFESEYPFDEVQFSVLRELPL